MHSLRNFFSKEITSSAKKQGLRTSQEGTVPRNCNLHYAKAWKQTNLQNVFRKNITDYAAWQHFSVVLFCYLHIVKTEET